MSRGRAVLIGILRLARGRADGMAMFEATPAAVLSSLAPLVALLLVAAGVSLLRGFSRNQLADLLVLWVLLLAPLVLSHELARRWNRGAQWFRFAAAFCWCQWAAPLVLVVLVLAVSLAIALGVPGDAAAMGGVAGLSAYSLWLFWFLAKHGLELSSWRAVALVASVTAMLSVLVSVPSLLAGLVAAG